jgi:hypothetical protein
MVIMDVGFERYGARFGSFSRMKCSKKVKGDRRKDQCKTKLRSCGVVTATIFVVSGVEINPGPFTLQEAAPIFQFIKKMEKI